MFRRIWTGRDWARFADKLFCRTTCHIDSNTIGRRRNAFATRSADGIVLGQCLLNWMHAFPDVEHKVFTFLRLLLLLFQFHWPVLSCFCCRCRVLCCPWRDITQISSVPKYVHVLLGTDGMAAAGYCTGQWDAYITVLTSGTVDGNAMKKNTRQADNAKNCHNNTLSKVAAEYFRFISFPTPIAFIETSFRYVALRSPPFFTSVRFWFRWAWSARSCAIVYK